MQMQHVHNAPQITQPAMPEPEELIRLILKLRWIGLDDEANHLQRVVCELAPDARPTALAGPIGTD